MENLHFISYFIEIKVVTYMAPEYAKKGHFSPKSDVHSFGILVLEIVTGQKISSLRKSINLQSCLSMLVNCSLSCKKYLAAITGHDLISA